jgi:hypothetical protein
VIGSIKFQDRSILVNPSGLALNTPELLIDILNNKVISLVTTIRQ